MNTLVWVVKGRVKGSPLNVDARDDALYASYTRWHVGSGRVAKEAGCSFGTSLYLTLRAA
jgi:hypothetical protein